MVTGTDSLKFYAIDDRVFFFPSHLLMEKQAVESQYWSHCKTYVVAAARISAYWKQRSCYAEKCCLSPGDSLKSMRKILSQKQESKASLLEGWREYQLSEHTLLSTGGNPSETGEALRSQSYSISGETRSRQNEQNHSPLWTHVRIWELLGSHRC